MGGSHDGEDVEPPHGIHDDGVGFGGGDGFGGDVE